MTIAQDIAGVAKNATHAEELAQECSVEIDQNWEKEATKLEISGPHFEAIL